MINKITKIIEKFLYNITKKVIKLKSLPLNKYTLLNENLYIYKDEYETTIIINIYNSYIYLKINYSAKIFSYRIDFKKSYLSQYLYHYTPNNKNIDIYMLEYNLQLLEKYFN